MKYKFLIVLFFLSNVATAENVNKEENQKILYEKDNINSTGGFSIEIADPRYSRFGIFFQTGKKRKVIIATGLKYAYGQNSILLNINDKEH